MPKPRPGQPAEVGGVERLGGAAQVFPVWRGRCAVLVFGHASTLGQAGGTAKTALASPPRSGAANP